MARHHKSKRREKPLFEDTAEGKLHKKAVREWTAKNERRISKPPKSKLDAPGREDRNPQAEPDSPDDQEHDAIQEVYELDRDEQSNSHFVDGAFQITEPRTVPGQPDSRTEVPEWGKHELIVLAFLAYRYPDFESDPRAHKRYMRDLETISVRWWARPLGKDSPILNDSEEAIRKRLERLRTDGDKVIVRSETDSWRLRDEAQEDAYNRLKAKRTPFTTQCEKSFIWGFSDEQFKRMVEMALRPLKLKIRVPDDLLLQAIRSVRGRPFQKNLELARRTLDTDLRVADVLPLEITAILDQILPKLQRAKKNPS